MSSSMIRIARKIGTSWAVSGHFTMKHTTGIYRSLWNLGFHEGCTHAVNKFYIDDHRRRILSSRC